MAYNRIIDKINGINFILSNLTRVHASYIARKHTCMATLPNATEATVGLSLIHPGASTEFITAKDSILELQFMTIVFPIAKLTINI